MIWKEEERNEEENSIKEERKEENGREKETRKVEEKRNCGEIEE